MTVTVAQIKTEFPEFANTSADLIAAKLADAERLIGRNELGALRDDAVKYYTCHLICLAPHGEFARLVEMSDPEGSSSIYERQYKHIICSMVVGPIVV